MHWNTQVSRRRCVIDRVVGAIALLLIIASVTGCQQRVNPFKDHFAGQDAVTTPSADVVWSCEREASSASRGYSESFAKMADGVVPHYPVYFKTFTCDVEEDTEHAWTCRDYMGVCCGSTAFVLDAVTWPVQAIINPPLSTRLSDGYGSSTCCAHCGALDPEDP